MKSDSDNVLSRRKALAGAGAVGAVAAAATLLPAAKTPATEAVATAAPVADASAAAGYRLTEHIKSYYSSARS